MRNILQRRQLAAFLTILLVALAAVAASGCGGDDDGGDETEAQAQETTQSGKAEGDLEILMTTGSEPSWELMVENFEKENPGVKVDLNFAPAEGIVSTINTQLAAGSAPDVFFARPGAAQQGAALAYAEEGAAADLSDVLSEDDLLPSSVPHYTKDGKIYGYTTTVIAQGIFYDVDALEGIGAEVPTQFSDLLTLCEEFAKTTEVPIAIAAAEPTWNAVLAENLANNEVFSQDPEWSDKRASGEVEFTDSSEWQTTLGQIQQMIDAGCFGPRAAAITQERAITLFTTQKSPMLLFVSLFGGAISEANPKLKFGMFSVPAEDPANTVATLSLDNGVVVNADSENLPAAKAFMKFLAQPEQAQAYAEAAGTLSPAAVAAGDVPDFMKAGMGPLFDEGRTHALGAVNWQEEVFLEAMGGGAQGLFTGQKSVDDILADMDSAWGQ